MKALRTTLFVVLLFGAATSTSVVHSEGTVSTIVNGIGDIFCSAAFAFRGSCQILVGTVNGIVKTSKYPLIVAAFLLIMYQGVRLTDYVNTKTGYQTEYQQNVDSFIIENYNSAYTFVLNNYDLVIEFIKRNMETLINSLNLKDLSWWKIIHG
jgi:hypothetical protein